MEVQLLTKTVYGNQTFYPMNDAAKTFSALTGKKTLNAADIKKIQSLGFNIKFYAEIANAQYEIKVELN